MKTTTPALSAQPPASSSLGFMERYGWDKLLEEAIKDPGRFAYTEEELVGRRIDVFPPQTDADEE